MDGAEATLMQRALDRFEDVMGRRHRPWLERLRPGLDDAGLDSLREAVAPYRVPGHVEALYRWCDGGDSGVFGGWRMRQVEELVDWYRYNCEDPESPRTWLPVFDDQIVNVVTLDVPGLPPSDSSVWYGHTHDGFLWRLFDSIPTLLDVVCDAVEDGALVEMNGRLGLPQGDGIDSLDGFAWSTYRLRRSPTAYRYPDPPAGTETSRHPTLHWPWEWLVPLGATEESFRLRGCTHTIAELLAAADAGPVRGTIPGRIVSASLSPGSWNPVVDDGTGGIVVVCESRNVPISANVGEDAEFDVALEAAAQADPMAGDNPTTYTTTNRLGLPFARARALSARPLPATLRNVGQPGEN